MSIKKYSDANGLSRFWGNVKNIIPTQNDIINLIKTTILDVYYPVGSYYETSDVNFNPNNQWGGTWVLEAEGQFHISAGATTKYNIGQTGGSPDAVVVSHNHTAKNGAVGNNPSAFNTNSSGTCTTSETSKTLTAKVQSRRYGSGSGTSIIVSATGCASHTTDSNKVNTVSTGGGVSSTRDVVNYDFTHSHTIPNHTHSIPANSHTHNFTQPTIESKGVDGTDKNLPPFIAVNRWHRTA